MELENTDVDFLTAATEAKNKYTDIYIEFNGVSDESPVVISKKVLADCDQFSLYHDGKSLVAQPYTVVSQIKIFSKDKFIVAKKSKYGDLEVSGWKKELEACGVKKNIISEINDYLKKEKSCIIKSAIAAVKPKDFPEPGFDDEI